MRSNVILILLTKIMQCGDNYENLCLFATLRENKYNKNYRATPLFYFPIHTFLNTTCEKTNRYATHRLSLKC